MSIAKFQKSAHQPGAGGSAEFVAASGFPNIESDARIIEAMMRFDTLPASLSTRVGVGEAVIRARAREIGLSKEFIKKCRLSGSRPAMRECIRCDTLFLSSGIHNRLCPRCPKR